MATGFSSTIITAWLNTLRGTNMTAPAGSFAKLHTGDPGGAGTANASAGSTTRVTFAFAAVSGTSITLTGTAPTWTNGGTGETITYVSVWDAVTSGTFDYSFPAATPTPWVSTNTITMSSLTVSIAPLAA